VSGSSPIVIQTDKDKVRCSQFDTHLECLGIPYAAPPLDDLRLRAPIEHAAWTDVRDATRFASASLQAKTEYDRKQGSEDCLYLNIYKPAANDGSPLTVMVWIHGGAPGILFSKYVNCVPRRKTDARWNAEDGRPWKAGLLMVAPAVEGIDLFKIAGRSISG
jgi:hypothetical protein